MRYLNKNTSPIASVGFTTAGAPVAHAFQHGNGVHDKLMRLACFDVGDETYTTGVFFKRRMV